MVAAVALQMSLQVNPWWHQCFQKEWKQALWLVSDQVKHFPKRIFKGLHLKDWNIKISSFPMQSFKSVERYELGLSLSGITRWHQYGMSPYRSLTANTLVSSSFRFSDTFQPHTGGEGMLSCFKYESQTGFAVWESSECLPRRQVFEEVDLTKLK